MKLFVDLHTHSTASDGSDTPSALVAKAAGLKLAALALTDHDSLSGLDEAEEAGRRFHIECIRGCEIAVATPYGEAHLLGLWLPRQTPTLGPALERLREARLGRARLMTDKLLRAGIPVTYDAVLAQARGESVGRPHIAALLVSGGFARDMRDAFARYLGEGRPMFVPRALPDPREGMALLRAEGATIVLAHPMLLHAPASWLDDFIADLRAAGLDALEAHHAEHGAADIRSCLSLASRHGLALSGGSDYHGTGRGDIALGTGKGGLRVPLSLLETLKSLRRGKGLPL